MKNRISTDDGTKNIVLNTCFAYIMLYDEAKSILHEDNKQDFLDAVKFLNAAAYGSLNTLDQIDAAVYIGGKFQGAYEEVLSNPDADVQDIIEYFESVYQDIKGIEPWLESYKIKLLDAKKEGAKSLVSDLKQV